MTWGSASLGTFRGLTASLDLQEPMRGFHRTLALMHRLLFYGRNHCHAVAGEVPARGRSEMREPKPDEGAQASAVCREFQCACTVTGEQRHRQACRFRRRLEETVSVLLGA